MVNKKYPQHIARTYHTIMLRYFITLNIDNNATAANQTEFYEPPPALRS
jgi:hypothetical protein